MLYTLILKIKHKCPFSMFSEKYSSFEIFHWCNSQYDVLELRGEADEVEKTVGEISNELGLVLKVFPIEEQTQIVIKHCECDQLPFINIPEKFGCIQIPPVKYLAGIEIQKLIVTLDNVQHLMTEYKKTDPTAAIEILSLAPLKDVEDPKIVSLYVEEFRKDLTDKQYNAITKAYDQGYYDIPRNVSVDSLAEEMNISRRTYEEHLRKAEKKIMRKLIPLIKFK
ncbi:helix-turn-helix domain-containing protein [Candidatus Hodarchaeum mangrovi]